MGISRSPWVHQHFALGTWAWDLEADQIIEINKFWDLSYGSV